MKGIYLIRNKINGKEYIGQTNNINLRFQQHRSNEKKYNDEFHLDIQKFGKDKFDYIVLEECDDDCTREYMLSREKYYIRKLKPYYNIRGQEDNSKLKAAVSKGTKQWWENLPEETKDKIIKNNLKGPAKGHTVSEETRKKLRKNPNCKHFKKVRIIETGEVFRGISDLEKHLGACTGTYASYKKRQNKIRKRIPY